MTDAMTAAELPADFADLAPFSGWILETWRERYEKRLASSMVEMQAFYDALLPRLSDLIEHCNAYDINDLPRPEHNLLLMAMSVLEVSFPVDAWRQPRVPDSGSADLEIVREPLL